jgi:hypothetical protein
LHKRRRFVSSRSDRGVELLGATAPDEWGFRFESLVIDLAAGFINVDPGRVDLVIEECLRRIVEALGLDRSTLFQRSGEDLVVTHS